MKVEATVGVFRTPEFVIAELKPRVLEVVKNVVADPTEYQDHIDERVSIEREIAQYYRSSGHEESWDIFEGFYGSDSHRFDTPLGASELAMDIQIQELLARRKSDDKPVVAVDFGGGLGVSMIRIASRHRKAIEDGDLFLAVTNLGYLPQSESHRNSYSLIASRLSMKRNLGDSTSSQSQLQFIQDNQSLVTYIDATAPELATNFIISKGKQIPLRGAVDIIHESYSLMHSHIPDIALAVFGELLSTEGSLYLGTRRRDDMMRSRLSSIQVGERSVDLNTEDHRRRIRDGLEVGIHLLQEEYGMRKRHEGVHYTLFTKSHLPRPSRRLRSVIF